MFSWEQSSVSFIELQIAECGMTLGIYLADKCCNISLADALIPIPHRALFFDKQVGHQPFEDAVVVYLPRPEEGRLRRGGAFRAEGEIHSVWFIWDIRYLGPVQ